MEDAVVALLADRSATYANLSLWTDRTDGVPALSNECLEGQRCLTGFADSS